MKMSGNFDNKLICNELMNIPGIRSVILIGSRARGEATGDSDFDLFVVVPILFIPFIYGKLKQKELILKNRLRSDVSIAPMTLWRLTRGRDLLLFKTKKDGITLCGKTYLSKITINNIDEISSDEIFSYFFSAAYFLVEHFDPEKEIDEKCLHGIAKTVLYCAEIELMMAGIYESKRDKIIRELEEMKLTRNLEMIKISRNILNDALFQKFNEKEYWFSAREYLLQLFSQLNKIYYGFELDCSLDISINKLKTTNRSIIKNFQFLLLMWMEKRNFHLFNIFSKRSIEKHLWASILYLIISVDKNRNINKLYLNNSYKTLVSMELCSEIENSNFDAEQWRKAKTKIIEYWSLACGKCAI